MIFAIAWLPRVATFHVWEASRFSNSFFLLSKSGLRETSLWRIWSSAILLDTLKIYTLIMSDHRELNAGSTCMGIHPSYTVAVTELWMVLSVLAYILGEKSVIYCGEVSLDPSVWNFYSVEL